MLPITKVQELPWASPGDLWQIHAASKVQHLEARVQAAAVEQTTHVCSHRSAAWQALSANRRSQDCSAWHWQPHWAGVAWWSGEGALDSVVSLVPTPTFYMLCKGKVPWLFWGSVLLVFDTLLTSKVCCDFLLYILREFLGHQQPQNERLMNLTTHTLKSLQGYNYYRQRSHKMIY